LGANPAIYSASQQWILRRTPANFRVVNLSYTQIGFNVGLLVPAFALGLIAGQGPAIWPLVLMLSLNVTAIVAAAQVPHAKRQTQRVPPDR
jgi:hypothetical protein